MDGSFEGEGPRRVVLASVGLLLAVFAWVAWQGLSGGDVTPTPSPTPFRFTPSPSPVASAEPIPTTAATASPTPEPTPREGTLLFEGGPARGPWQQLGTVAEITHPGAPQSARYSWTNFWTDPEEENQPDELWDRLVVEVTDQLVELGEPVDRPAFGAAVGSEPFNGSGGLKDFYSDERVFTASWQGVFEDQEGVGFAFYAYLIDFDTGEILQVGPRQIYRDDGIRTFEDNTTESFSWMRAWAAEQGLTECARCS